MLIILLLLSCIFCFLAYRYYGAFLSRRCGVDNSRITPACSMEDGVDYVPTRPSVLFGHHFSSIAGAGPIVGPILAGMYFGWFPTWLWIIVGAIFVGGVHDFGSAFMSIRNKGRSIAEISRQFVGEGTGKLFIVFVICALIYVVVVFLDLTAMTFTQAGAVATASGWFVAVALVFGFFAIYKKIPLKYLVPVFVPVTFLGLWIGHIFPAVDLGKNTWITVVLLYCFVAAILPVNILLQPRDFLSATFLYAMMILGLTGLFFSNAPIQIDMFHGWYNEKANPAYLMPALFITVACGACSGFHSVVSSGTTSKQIREERDVQRINYGSMLVEGVLAVFALATLAVLSAEEVRSAGTPIAIFANGASVFMGAIGLPRELAREFTLLAVSTFLLTTLDTCTRLCRFLLEELFNKRNALTRYGGTFAVLVIPGLLAFMTIEGQPAWRAIWPLFGATNQLMAALALITFVAFLKANQIRYGFALIPAVVMIVMPLVALVMLVLDKGAVSLLGTPALVMFLLGLLVCGMAVRFLTTPPALNIAESRMES